jgi:hypothetical protein
VFPNASVPVNGVMMTILQIVAVLQTQLTAEQQAATLKSDAHVAVVAADTGMVQVRAMMRDVQNWAGGMLGVTSSQYARLGFAVPKKAVKSPEVKAAAAAKAKATRASHDGKDKVAAPEPAEAPSVAKKPTGGNG